MQIHHGIKDGFNHYKLVYSEYQLGTAVRDALNCVGEDHSDHCKQHHLIHLSDD